MSNDELIPILKERFRHPLPGKAAQDIMASSGRTSLKVTRSDNYRIACVLCLLYLKNGAWHIVLIERVTAQNDRHSGQMSFPGGKYEEADVTFENGALREAEEEIGINPDEVYILGALTPLFIPVSNFMVYPFVGFMEQTPIFTPQPDEVAEIVEVPLKLLLAKATKQRKSLTIHGGFTLKDVPYFNVKGKTVWGATAMMLSEFVEMLNDSLNPPLSKKGCTHFLSK